MRAEQSGEHRKSDETGPISFSRTARSFILHTTHDVSVEGRGGSGDERSEYDSACIFVLNPDSRLNHPTAQGELWALHVHSLHPNSEPE